MHRLQPPTFFWQTHNNNNSCLLTVISICVLSHESDETGAFLFSFVWTFSVSSLRKPAVSQLNWSQVLINRDPSRANPNIIEERKQSRQQCGPSSVSLLIFSPHKSGEKRDNDQEIDGRKTWTNDDPSVVFTLNSVALSSFKSFLGNVCFSC